MVTTNYSNLLEVKDNYLDDKDFKGVTDIIMDSPDFLWVYSPYVAYPEGVSYSEEKEAVVWGNAPTTELGQIYYYHNIGGTDEPAYNFMLPIYKKLGIGQNTHDYVRTRAIHYPRTERIIKHPLHFDDNKYCKTLLLYLNTCDGYTYHKPADQKIYNVANRALIFDASELHHSTTTTNADRRVILQINIGTGPGALYS